MSVEEEQEMAAEEAKAGKPITKIPYADEGHKNLSEEKFKCDDHGYLFESKKELDQHNATCYYKQKKHD